MAHKVHPTSFRIKGLASWSSRWLEKNKMPQYLEEDFRIREFLDKKIGKFGVEKIEIERLADRLTVIIFCSRPGLIIGRGGEGIEILRKALEKNVLKTNLRKKIKDKTEVAAKSGEIRLGGSKKGSDLKIEVREIKDPWSSAALSGQSIAQQIEKRFPFRRAMKQAMEKIMASKQNKGARIELSGRLDGKDIARREWAQKGRLPRQTIRADIDYAQTTAMCAYGTIGIKVWIYKGDKFDD